MVITRAARIAFSAHWIGSTSHPYGPLALAVAILVPAWMASRADHLSRRRFLESVSSISNEVYACFVNAAAKCHAGQGEGLLFVTSVAAFHRFRIVSSAINAIRGHAKRPRITDDDGRRLDAVGHGI
jgi:hypothetical protein